MTSLPVFRYHPDPVATEVFQTSAGECRCCGRARGVIYVGPVHADDRLAERLCPWCIADGSAARTFDAVFTELGADVPSGVPGQVLEELATRTPGFTGWKHEHWLYHCDDAAAYLGLASDDPAAGLLGAATVSATYRFRCLHCSTELSYSDAP